MPRIPPQYRRRVCRGLFIPVPKGEAHQGALEAYGYLVVAHGLLGIGGVKQEASLVGIGIPELRELISNQGWEGYPAFGSRLCALQAAIHFRIRILDPEPSLGKIIDSEGANLPHPKASGHGKHAGDAGSIILPLQREEPAGFGEGENPALLVPLGKSA